MSFQTVIWISCFISAVTSTTSQNIQTDSIDRTVVLGQFINIGNGVAIGAGSEIMNFVSIAPYTLIGENSSIGRYSNISQMCSIGNDVHIQTFTKLGCRSVIGSGSEINDYSVIGNKVKIGDWVKMNQYSTVGGNADILDNSILGMYSAVGYNAMIQPKVCIGMYSFVEPNAVVGESAVIHKFVKIPSGTIVKPKQVVIRIPSSLELYQSCAPDVSGENVNIAARSTNGTVSKEFNDMLRRLIDTELQTLSANCAQATTVIKPSTLPQIISLYLIQVHGFERFKEYVQQVRKPNRPITGTRHQYTNGRVWIDGVKVDCLPSSSMNSQLENEYPFGDSCENISKEYDQHVMRLRSNSPINEAKYQISFTNNEVWMDGVKMDCTPSNSLKEQFENEYPLEDLRTNVLQPDVKKKLIEMMAIVQDVDRSERGPDDTFCKMMEEIINGVREVTFASPSIRTQSTSTNYW